MQWGKQAGKTEFGKLSPAGGLFYRRGVPPMARDALEQPDDPAMTADGTAAIAVTSGTGPMLAGMAQSRHAGEDGVYRRM